MMEVLVEIIVALVAFLCEATLHALVFIYLLLRAIFSPAYRWKLREHWNTTTWRRAAIVLGVSLYAAVLVTVLLGWHLLLS